MKTNPMPGNKIEFFCEIGQRNLRMNPRDCAADIQQFGDASEERLLISIEAEPFVTEELADVQEISGAASEIKNAQRRSAIEPKILGAFDIDADPIGGVFVCIDLSRIRPVGIIFAQPG